MKINISDNNNLNITLESDNVDNHINVLKFIFKELGYTNYISDNNLNLTDPLLKKIDSELMSTERSEHQHYLAPIEQYVDSPPIKDVSIRYYEDTPKYQTYYVCPECGNKAKRYLSKDEKVCECHKCNHTMEVMEATEKGFPYKDQFGNFFIAGDRYPGIPILPDNANESEVENHG